MQLFTNNASATLASPLASGGLSLTLSSGQGALFPTITGSDFFVVTLQSSTAREIVKVTARSSDTMTIVRAQEGTSASSFAAGDTVKELVAAGAMTFIMNCVYSAAVAAIQALTPSSGKIPYFTSGTAASLLTLDTDGTLAANSDTTLASQKAVKTYTDTKVNGLSWKQAVRAATTAPGTLASSFENGDTIDGVTLATGNRILIKDQAAPAENGIYVVAASGAPTRATDADSGAELVNASCYVSEGTANADTQWTCTTNATITINSTSLAFAQLTSGGSIPASAITSGQVALARGGTVTHSNMVAGIVYTLEYYTGAGSFTATFASTNFAGGTAPTLTVTASKVDVFTFYKTIGGTIFGGIFGQSFAP